MTKDMTSGNPLKLIIGFAIPMFLGMLFQQFYSMVDTVIVGKFLGVGPLAGVGSTSSLNFLVIGFCTGVCNGFAIPVSQMFGAKRDSELRRFVANSAWLCVIFSVVITTAIVACCRPLLTLMHTPKDIFEYAYVYIVIIFLGIPTTFLYNVTAAIIRSLGDSRSPVVFLAIASGINIVLDIVFIVAFHMGVEGPALATVISQGISGLLSLFYMKKKFEILRISKEEWKMRGAYMKTLCYMGIPRGLQYSVTAIGTLVIQAAINGFGSMTVAGVTAAQRINAFISCPIEAIGATMAPYSGQNMGAGKLDRVGKGLRDASLLGFVISAVLFVFTAAGYCLLVLVNTVRFTIQGMGFSVFAITSGVLEMIARSLAGLVVVPLIGYTGICLAHPMAWIFADAFLIPAFFYCKKKIVGLYK